MVDGVKRPGLFLISIGDELLDGRTANTNATYFGELCRQAGVPVAEIRTVGDKETEIARALRDASAFSLVFVTGGLGPTNDDRTAASAALAFGRLRVPHPAALRRVRAHYKARGVKINKIRLSQAHLPEGAEILPNPTGIAPPFRLRWSGTDYYFAPGVPGECRPLFRERVLPVAQARFASRKLKRRLFWRCFGAGESEIYRLVAPAVKRLEKRYPRTLTIGVHITFPYIDITLESWSAKSEKPPAAAVLRVAEKEISRRLGDYVFSRERESMAETVFRALKRKRATLSTAESCTGGWVGKLLTDIPGSSAVYEGGVVSYADAAKQSLLGLEHATLRREGAVSRRVARAMAEAIRKRLGTTYALALTGISGPGGGSKAKPVGTIHIALAGPRQTKTLHQVIFGGQLGREQNRLISAHLALNLLRLTMKRVD